MGGERYNLFRGCPQARTATIVLRGGSEQFIDEADRSLHDAIMIVRRCVGGLSRGRCMPLKRVPCSAPATVRARALEQDWRPRWDRAGQAGRGWLKRCAGVGAQRRLSPRPAAQARPRMLSEY